MQLGRSVVQLSSHGDFGSAFVPVMLFTVRCIARVAEFASFVAGRLAMPRGGVATATAEEGGLQAHVWSQRLAGLLATECAPLLAAWIAQADAADDVAAAVALHAHHAIALAPSLLARSADACERPAFQSTAACALSSLVFVTSWCTHAGGGGGVRTSASAVQELLRDDSGQALAQAMGREGRAAGGDKPTNPGRGAVGDDVAGALGSALRTHSTWVPGHALFRCYQRLRPVLVTHLASLPSPERDLLLSSVVATAMRKRGAGTSCGRLSSAAGPVAAALTSPAQPTAPAVIAAGPVSAWREVSSVDFECEMVLESEHPYLPSQDRYYPLHFPGAPHMVVRFDARTAMETGNSDFIAFHRDATLSTHWGPVARYGGSTSAAPHVSRVASTGWPGSEGMPPLIIPADTAYMRFHSDSYGSDWGFRVTITAPVCEATAILLSQEGWAALAEPGVELSARTASAGGVLPLDWCNAALAACWNNVDLARAWLSARTAEVASGRPPTLADVHGLTDRESAGAAPASSAALPNASAGATVASLKRGLYRDAGGYVELNVQTGELFVRGRQLTPVPANIASHPDFRDAFVAGATAHLPFIFDARTLLGETGEGLGTDAGDPDAGSDALGRGGSSKSAVCTVISRNTHRTWVRLFRDRGEYDVLLWCPLRPDSETLMPEEVPLQWSAAGVQTHVEAAAGSGPMTAEATLDMSMGAGAASASLLPQPGLQAVGATEIDGNYFSHGMPRMVRLHAHGLSGEGAEEEDGPFQLVDARAATEGGGAARNEALLYRGRLYRRQVALFRSLSASAPDSGEDLTRTLSFADFAAIAGEKAASLLRCVAREAIDSCGLGQEPVFWLQDGLCGAGSQSVGALSLIMHVPPQGDISARRSALGHFFEVALTVGNSQQPGCSGASSGAARSFSPAIGAAAGPPYMEVFQLIDHGRTAARCLVYTTDQTRALRYLPLPSTDRVDPPAEGAGRAAG
jgi:hypothetical protein